MSKDLELQPIIPNGRHSTPDNMSGSGSFTTPSPHDVASDMVSNIPPVYASVPEAQAAHGRYTAQQVKPVSVGIVSQGEEYTSPVGMDPPNTYDMIPENGQRKERSHSPVGRPLMADNVLYGTPADEQLKHRTLTMEKAAAEGGQQFNQRFTGSVSSQLIKEPGEGSTGVFTGRCCGVCLMLVLVFVVAFLAVAALVLVLSIMFQIYPVCDCTNTQEIKNLQNQVSELMAAMPTQATETPQLDDIRSRISALESNTMLQAGTNYTSVLSGFDLFSNCTTVTEAGSICVGSSPCESFFNTPIQVPGEFTMDMRCVRLNDRNDRNETYAFEISATLNIDGNNARCICHTAESHPVNCGLQVTRCAVPQSITADFMISHSP